MSANGPDHLEFQGKDLKECEQFIATVNKYARAEDKFRDDQWIADLVGAIGNYFEKQCCRDIDCALRERAVRKPRILSIGFDSEL
ncbi:hypothetical protein M407DRAFT_35065 [Tulasnella calospora MUT 4182]|uniref:Uncharacterized protein n=1 Tax=Tulasnella calospora MUT 4182 TaxID=1051891 RepID=A0A0C3K1U8_9AGAM|nr:hypothetical protein M407DRAFT_35065 [Tulasnella calospora MUT 4182]